MTVRHWHLLKSWCWFDWNWKRVLLISLPSWLSFIGCRAYFGLCSVFVEIELGMMDVVVGFVCFAVYHRSRF